MNETTEFLNEIKKDSRRRKQNNLNSFDLVDWTKRSYYEYFKKINSKTFTYYPTTKCLVYKHKSYKGINKDFLNKKCNELMDELL